MQLFYHPELDIETGHCAFDREESKHIVKVLRKKEGDILFVTNGRGQLFRTEIRLASDSRCQVAVLAIEAESPARPTLHLAVAPTKMNERYEWFLEKATEIGISEITPIICDHSERKVIKAERMEKILLSAMKQSNQYTLPTLHPQVSFRDFIQKNTEEQRFIAHCAESDRRSLKAALQPDADCLVLIGPEGDFSEKEINLALQNGFMPVTLGQTRLRTETAAVVACHSVVLLNEK